MTKVMITLDSLIDTRYYLLSKIDPMYIEPKYLDGYVNRDTDMLPFIGNVFKDEYTRRHRVYVANALPTSLITFLKLYLVDVIEKHGDALSIDINVYPYSDLMPTEVNNIVGATHKLYNASKTEPICEKASVQLYSEYDYIFDYDGLKNVLHWINTKGKPDDITNVTIIAPLLSDEAGGVITDFTKLSESLTSILSDVCNIELVPPSIFSLLSID